MGFLVDKTLRSAVRIRNARRVAALVAALAAGDLVAVPAAQAVTLRHQANQAGDFVLIGNTLGQDCGSQTPSPVVGTVGTCGGSTSDTSPDVFWRADDSGGERPS